ncbi:MAG: hypothetical protein NVSMB64_09020 [Candidatus Velthaea sp.]
MEHDDRAVTLGDERTHERERLEGVTHVEMARRFIEQQRARVLCERKRDPHTLALAARELRERPVDHRLQAEPRDCAVDRFPVGVRRRPPPPGSERQTSHRDDLARGYALRHETFGLDERRNAAAFGCAELRERVSVDLDRSGIDGEHPGERAQQLRFACAVRADERQ